MQIPAEMVHYGMTKTAQISVARGIAELVAGTGVAANGILAGPTESEGVGGFVEAMAKHQNKSKEEVEKELLEHARPSLLLKRFATADEVAAMATYVAGKLSTATNGTVLRMAAWRERFFEMRPSRHARDPRPQCRVVGDLAGLYAKAPMQPLRPPRCFPVDRAIRVAATRLSYKEPVAIVRGNQEK